MSMFNNRTNSFIVGCFSLTLLVCIVGASSLAWYKKSTECFKNRPPLISFILTIDHSQQRLLIEQAQKFADKHSFKSDIAYYTPQRDHFLIDLRRKDTEVIISNGSFDLDKFDAFFYNNDCIHPTVASNIVDLASDLRRFISKIPNAIISEEK